MGRIKIEGYVCERCEHEWVSRNNITKEEPRVCPRCKSPYWNVPRKRKVKNKNQKNKKNQKSRKKVRKNDR